MGTNVSSIHDHILLSCKRSLKFQEFSSDFRNRRCHRSHISNFFCTKLCCNILSIYIDLLDSAFITNRYFHIFAGLYNLFCIFWINSKIQKVNGQSTVHCAGIYINISVFFCNLLCNCTFSCPCRSIDCYIISHFYSSIFSFYIPFSNLTVTSILPVTGFRHSPVKFQSHPALIPARYPVDHAI